MDEQVTTTSPVTVEDQIAKRRAFGSMMQKARLSAGMSEEAVSQSTRISRQFIIALETGDFAKLPGILFGRGFVQSIARLVGADETLLVAMFLDCAKESSAVAKPLLDLEQQQFAEPRKIEARLKIKPVRSAPMPKPNSSVSEPIENGLKVKVISQWTAVSIGAVLVIGLAVLFAVGRVNTPNIEENAALTPDKTQVAGDSSATPTSTESIAGDSTLESSSEDEVHQDPPSEAALAAGVAPIEPVAPIQPQAPIAPVVPVTPVIPDVNNAAPVTPTVVAASPPSEAQVVKNPPPAQALVAEVSSPKESVADGQQVLELVVKSAVKIKLGVDGASSETQDLKPDTYRYQFKERAELMIYDAASVDVAFNGRSLGSLGSKGRIRRLSFAAPLAAQSAVPSSRIPPQ